ncbi:hypothetical protein P368_05900 [Comamonas thiooxydans]|nr:hypothetical protein P365_07945 [Comamonas thiooxydans]KGH14489.1 hypothetical protein P368_05900 [Comamonas thiooxydans]
MSVKFIVILLTGFTEGREVHFIEARIWQLMLPYFLYSVILLVRYYQ